MPWPFIAFPPLLFLSPTEPARLHLARNPSKKTTTKQPNSPQSSPTVPHTQAAATTQEMSDSSKIAPTTSLPTRGELETLPQYPPNERSRSTHHRCLMGMFGFFKRLANVLRRHQFVSACLLYCFLLGVVSIVSQRYYNTDRRFGSSDIPFSESGVRVSLVSLA